MKAEKDPKTGKWLIQYRYTDWQGNRKKSTKRGFDTKREAEEWLRRFLDKQKINFDMNFEEFVEIYMEDMAARLREHTMVNKRYIIELKILPYFGKKKVNSITAADVRKWQNTLMKRGYSKTYLKTINNQLSAIFNYASRYYDYDNNPCRKAGSMGKNKADEMKIWTKEEFGEFIDVMMNKRQSYVAFMILYWTGIRVGELLALTPGDFDFENLTLSITKSYQRIKGRDVITEPKTPKSRRVISIPKFLAENVKEYIDYIYGMESDDRMFPFAKTYIEHEMKRGIKLSGVKPIRVHDLRHSHASLLVEMGFSILEIAERLGHERVETTMDTYAHLYPNKQTALADRLEKLYRNEQNYEETTA